ncbi:MAG TPA: hypothetical protein PLK77_14585 [Pyrinomonadaceae bacterium]|nr:hypothetical protein [Pyrinomonadaceae bacterium]
MRPILKSLIISTTIVVGYPIVVMVVLAPFGILWGGPYIDRALSALMIPMGLPLFIMDSLYPSGLLPRTPVLFVLVWFIAFNATLYYVPVRLLLEWRERKTRLR